MKLWTYEFCARPQNECVRPKRTKAKEFPIESKQDSHHVRARSKQITTNDKGGIILYKGVRLVTNII
ncbi:hypothetical protein P8452_21510 [Trifolium repens]|nr:hypothetical protein P8452_21510 [Trifolium repens]